MPKIWKHVFGVLGLIISLLVLSLYDTPEKNLHLIACDVGQGDAFLAIYGESEILIDGGRGNQVLDCLGRHLPYWDREIELVVLTHPDKDHYGGILEVFRAYKVGTLLVSGLDTSSDDYRVLEKEVGGSTTKVVYARSGQEVRMGLIRLDIVHPSNEYITTNSAEIEKGSEAKVLGLRTSTGGKNEFSVVARLSLGEFDALFTGDATPEVLDELVKSGKISDVEYITIPHHGSKNGLTQDLLEMSSPEVSVISVGKNSYGHPHRETLEMLKNMDIKTLRTDEEGDIEVISDGKKFWLQK